MLSFEYTKAFLKKVVETGFTGVLEVKVEKGKILGIKKKEEILEEDNKDEFLLIEEDSDGEGL